MKICKHCGKDIKKEKVGFYGETIMYVHKDSNTRYCQTTIAEPEENEVAATH